MTAQPPPPPPPLRPGRGRAGRLRGQGGHVIGAYGLLALTALLFLAFSLALPRHLPHAGHLDSILSNQSIPADPRARRDDPHRHRRVRPLHRLRTRPGTRHGDATHRQQRLALAARLPRGDRSAGRSSASSTVSSSSSPRSTPSSPPSAPAACCTPCTGWITDGARIVPGPQGLPAAFTDLYDSTVPRPAGPRLLRPRPRRRPLWLLLERLPLGRYLYVIGSNPRAADLVGIPTRRYDLRLRRIGADRRLRRCAARRAAADRQPAASASTTCCPPSSAHCSAPPRSDPAAPTPWAPSSPSPSSPSAWPASVSWAPSSGRPRCSTAARCSSPSAWPDTPPAAVCAAAPARPRDAPATPPGPPSSWTQDGGPTGTTPSTHARIPPPPQAASIPLVPPQEPRARQPQAALTVALKAAPPVVLRRSGHTCPRPAAIAARSGGASGVPDRGREPAAPPSWQGPRRPSRGPRQPTLPGTARPAAPRRWPARRSSTSRRP